MAFKSFKMWVEDVEARRLSSRSFLLDFLRREMKFTDAIDDDQILDMPLGGIAPGVRSKLLGTGVINTATPDIIDSIRNGGDYTVRELVDALSGDDSHTPNIPAD